MTSDSRTLRLRTEATKLTARDPEGSIVGCPPDKVQVYYSDVETQRLRLRVARSGRHVWDWRPRTGSPQVFGVYDPTGATGLTYAQAKTKADRLNLAVNTGGDPRATALTPPEVSTIREMVEHYITYNIAITQRTHRKKETEANIRSMLRHLLADHGDMEVIDVNQHVIMESIRRHDRTNCEAGRKVVLYYRAAWNFCHASGVLPKFDRQFAPLTNPASNLIRAVGKRELAVKRTSYKVTLKDAEIVAILKAIERGKAAYQKGRRGRPGEMSMHWPLAYAAVEFMIYTGCRKSEALFLRMSHIQGIRIVLEEHKTDEDQTVERIIQISPRAQRVLDEAAELRRRLLPGYDGSFVFPSEERITPVSMHSLKETLETACRAAGVRRLVPHNLRSAYINFCIRNNVPIDVVSKNVGHSDVRTTLLHYVEIEQEIRASGAEDASKALDRLFGVVPEFTRLR